MTDTSALQQTLPIASEWIVHSRAAFVRSIEASRDGNVQGQGQGAGTLYRGPDRLCAGRWQFWKGRFGDLAGQVQGDVKELALDCASKMESISN